mgnify:CR=1 FL=1
MCVKANSANEVLCLFRGVDTKAKGVLDGLSEDRIFDTKDYLGLFGGFSEIQFQKVLESRVEDT